MRHLVFLLALLAGTTPAGAAERPVVVVTTSMIATAVHDVAGDAVDIETLMPAGTCPGQFDLEPQQARRVRAAVLVIRHGFQGFLDARFISAGIRAGTVIAPPADEPFTLPANYARYCATLAAELTRRVPALAGPSVARLAAIRERASAEEEKLRAAARPLQGMRVAAATFQADFLRWLGLEVVAVFPPDEDPPPRTLMAVISAGREHGARLVVGNEQNGRRVPTAIAAALGVPPVMLSNFPVRATEGAYEQLLENNLQLLLAGAARSDAPVVTGAVRR